MLFIWIARDKKEMFTQANPWNMNLDPLGTLRENPNYCLSSSSSSMLRLLLHFRPRATKEVKENLTSIQRTRVMVISYQNIPRRTKRFEGAETRVWVSQVALVEKNPPAKAEDIRDESSSPGSGWSPGGGHGNALQYYFLENPMDRGAWQAAVHRVTQRRTWLKWISTVQTRAYRWNSHRNGVLSLEMRMLEGRES